MKEQRNFTVHEKELEISANANIDIASSITVAPKEEIKIEKYHEKDNGEKVMFEMELNTEYYNISVKGEIDNIENVQVYYQFFLEEWEGEDDILSLCLYCVNWLDSFIKRMINEGRLK